MVQSKPKNTLHTFNAHRDYGIQRRQIKEKDILYVFDFIEHNEVILFPEKGVFDALRHNESIRERIAMMSKKAIRFKLLNDLGNQMPPRNTKSFEVTKINGPIFEMKVYS